MWTAEVSSVPVFDEKYPEDPVDWEAVLTDGMNVINIVVTGTVQEDGSVRPEAEDQFTAWLDAMVTGLNALK